ncbi:MAG: cell division protein FtsA [Sutterellaceae bacterium]|nr:cell division protein FtsA [Sutterellaceae bacterium]
MEGVQNSSVIAALDIGTSKISVAVAEVDDNGALSILGFGKVGANGIHAGSVQDVELAVDSIRSAVSEAEQMSRRKITTVTAALTGKHLHCVNKTGQAPLPNAEVENNDIKRATRLAMTFDPKTDAESTDDRVVSHIIKGYTIDNDDTMIQDPLGMAGSVLKAHAHLALGSDSVVINLVKCIRRASLDLEGLVLQPWASAAGVLTPTEKELGVVLLDIGAGAVDIACYQGGNIEYTAVVPSGGDLITRDIASILQCRIDDAEDIKLTYGHVGLRPEDNFENICYVNETTDKQTTANNAKVVEIIESRSVEMLRLIAQYYLAKDKWLARAAAGIVITGGVARMPGFRELAETIFGLPVRIGQPPVQKRSALTLENPEDATVVGVLLETVRRRNITGAVTSRSGRLDGFWGAMRRIVFGDFVS